MAWHGMAWHGMGVVMFLALMTVVGCAPSTDPLPGAAVDASGPAPIKEVVADLGVILAHGQTIEHEFTVRNDNDRPLQITDARALVPYCSEVLSFPQSVPAQGEAPLKVRFRPGFQSGLKQIGFALTTDHAEASQLVYLLRSDLVAEMEVVTVEGKGLSLLLGQTGHQRLRVLTRRLNGDGRGLPESLDATPRVTARFVGDTEERVLANGVVETAREIDVVVSATDAALGMQSVPLALAWDDGRTWEYILHWNVVPHLVAVPSALVVDANDENGKSITIRSSTSAFRVVGVDGASFSNGDLKAPPDVPKNVHVLDLVVARDQPESSRLTDVSIHTDHPQQQSVTISVLFTRPNAKEAP